MLPMKTNTNRTMVPLLIGMGFVTVALIFAAVYLILRGTNQPFTKEDGALRAYVQAPTLAEVGEATSLIVTVRNESEDYLSL
jgi:hypothetical protein